MRISQKAIEIMNNAANRCALALKLGVTEGWVATMLRENKTNGELTKFFAITEIMNITNLSQDDVIDRASESVAA